MIRKMSFWRRLLGWFENKRTATTRRIDDENPSEMQNVVNGGLRIEEDIAN